jgi:diazepam-binding inhibitor (GABA receptor modulator, acyl-CoA-binding protein)
MSLTDDFSAAALQSKSFTKRPSNEELLDLYALYKQATEGDNMETRPGGFDFKAIAKHDAWEEKKSLTKEQAMEKYVALVTQLAVEYN